MELWAVDKEEVALLRERVDEAGRLAVQELKEQGIRGGHGKKRKREEGGGHDDMDRDDDVVEAGMPKMKSPSQESRA